MALDKSKGIIAHCSKQFGRSSLTPSLKKKRKNIDKEKTHCLLFFVRQGGRTKVEKKTRRKRTFLTQTDSYERRAGQARERPSPP